MKRELAKARRKQLGANLRTARQHMGITQAQLAELLEMSTEVYGRMERGKIFPRVTRLIDICEKLGVSSDRLMDLPSSKKGGLTPGFMPSGDAELLAVLHRFQPVMPRLNQAQRLAFRRHMTELQRLVFALLVQAPPPTSKRRTTKRRARVDRRPKPA